MKPRVLRRLWAPEVVQTSAMDCGPASLKSLLEGHGIPVSYGRLREACQTEVDGTSIDTLEEVARQLGLDAEQVMLPPDHIFVPGRAALPALLVVTTADNGAHFVVAWNRVGPFVQIMDPAKGRRWLTLPRLAEELYIHAMPVSASGFEEWLRGDEFLPMLERRLELLDARDACRDLVDGARAAPGWKPLAALDASTRMVSLLVETSALRRGAEAAMALRPLFERALVDDAAVPAQYWTARETDPDESGEPQVRLRGALLVRIRGTRGVDAAAKDEAEPLPKELATALAETTPRPLDAVLQMLRRSGAFTPSLVAVTTVLAVACTTVEALLLRGVLDVGRRLGLYEQRLAAASMFVVFLLAFLLLELVLEDGVLRIGRQLETRFRLTFQTKIPRLGDRYFNSRPASDMAERAHNAHAIRTLPELGAQMMRCGLEAIVTAGALLWLDPRSLGLVGLLVLFSLAPPLVLQGVLTERDLKVRSHAGALTRFHLEALLGLTPLLAHSGERAFSREHEKLLTEWIRAGRSLVRVSVVVQAVHAVVTAAAVIAVVWTHVARTNEPATLLLFLYWALSLPAVGEELGLLARQYPSLKNRLLRLLEPLGAIDEEGARLVDAGPGRRGGVALELDGVHVLAGGHPVLDDVSVKIGAGQHVAIVGASGAGKSTLVGLLLGFHRAARGALRVDDAPLDVTKLRRMTAWVDPAVHLWNRSLAENLAYGGESTNAVGEVVNLAGLRNVVERLPEGLHSALGEGGTLVSGGEGQRVRVGRALARDDVRLVILDEPFRGLDRGARRELLAVVRQRFATATLLFVSHDIEETLAFDRVLVVEDGNVAEDGVPRDLARLEDSRYRGLLDADRRVGHAIWGGDEWRRIIVERGVIHEDCVDRRASS